MDDTNVFKIVMAGDGGVGKTTLLFNYLEGRFIEDMKLTIGVQIHAKDIKTGNATCTLQIWDIGGQEKFHFIHPEFILNAKGALLLYDLSDPGSTEHLASYWLNVIHRDDPGLPIVLVGNKLDLIDEVSRVVEVKMIEEFVKMHALSGHVEVSSKTGENVDIPFRLLVERMLDRERARH